MNLKDSPTLPRSATRPADEGTTVTSASDPVVYRDGAALLTGQAQPVYRKSCCQVPREQPCPHDLPAAAFEPGCRTAIICRPASQWGDA